jgi:hypothetical protein
LTIRCRLRRWQRRQAAKVTQNDLGLVFIHG